MHGAYVRDLGPCKPDALAREQLQVLLRKGGRAESCSHEGVVVHDGGGSGAMWSSREDLSSSVVTSPTVKQ